MSVMDLIARCFIYVLGFIPFTSAQMALEQALAVAEGTIFTMRPAYPPGTLTEYLKNFLEQNLPMEKKSKITLGVYDSNLGKAIATVLEIKVKSQKVIAELLR